ncbi:MAG: phasin family protein [Desulfocapsa sp.]|nr:phasin family protein [Desulfocapsa sp.]
MLELVKKVLLTGVGVAVLSKEKIEEVAKDFAEKGKMTEQEGKALVDDLLARSEESRVELQKQIEQRVQTVLEKMDLAKKSEVEALKLEIEELRRLVNTTEGE